MRTPGPGHDRTRARAGAATIRVAVGCAALALALAACADVALDLPRTATSAMSADDPDDDGLTTALETSIGTDPDDPDSDDDGFDDGVEFGDGPEPRDSDDDRVIDALDEDSDDDRVADRDEHGGLTSGAMPDTDGDGTPDPLDLDSDGDGISDRDEAGDDRVDTPPIDTDGDSTPDLIDLDSDDDGYPDKVEAGDADLSTPPRDSDRDGIPDARDFDSDDGGTSDRRERSLGTDPTDPTDDAARDGDGDGVDDDLETRLGMDPTDPDSDGDTIEDSNELGRVVDGVRDTDDDGIIDALDDDSDNDGIPDAVEAGDDDPTTPPVDTDGDGLPDYRDTDSDGGGVPDGIEVAVHGTDPTNIDDDGRGWFVDTDVDAGSYCTVGGAGGPAGLLVALVALVGLGRRRRTGRPLGSARPRSGRAARPHPAAPRLGVLLLAGCAGLAVAGQARPVAAQATEHPDARETGMTLLRDTLDPTGGPTGAGDAIPLPPRAVRLTFQLQVLHNPVVARDDDTGELVDRIVAYRRELDLAIAVGIAPRADLSLMAPIVVSQQARYPGADLPNVRRAGFADLVVTPRVRLTGPRHGVHRGGLALRIPVSLPTGGADAWMGHRGVSARPELVASVASSGVVFSTSAGVLTQPRVTIDDLVADDTVTGAVALRYLARQGWSADLSWRVERRIGAAPRPNDAVRGHVSAAIFKGWTHPVGVLFGGAIGHGGMAPNPSLRGFVGLAIQLDPDVVERPEDRAPAGPTEPTEPPADAPSPASAPPPVFEDAG